MVDYRTLLLLLYTHYNNVGIAVSVEIVFCKKTNTLHTRKQWNFLDRVTERELQKVKHHNIIITNPKGVIL